MWLKSWVVVALALLAAPVADRASQPVPLAHAMQVVNSGWAQGARPVLPWPAGAQAAVGASGLGVLAATPGAQPLPTASVAKVMTALVTLEQRPLGTEEQGPSITVTAQDVQDYQSQIAQDGSTVPVVAGEQLTERQALEALLLPSANNIAMLLARWVAGSVPAFVQLMNERARALGMTRTTYTDPSGLTPSTVSVPADLIRAGQAGMAIPVFAQIVGEKHATIPVAGTITNVDGVLGVDGIVGIKTGNSDEARAVYLAAATYRPAGGSPILVYAVVQGLATLSDCFAASERLVLAVESALKVVTIVSRGQQLGRYATAWGVSAGVVAAADLKVLVWPGTGVTAELHARALPTPAARGRVVGSLQVSVGESATVVPAALAGGIAAPTALWVLTRSVSISTLPPMELLTWFSLMLALAALLLVLGALLRLELQGPNVGLRLVTSPARDAWRVSYTGGAELSGTCVGLLTNNGSRAGAAWGFRVTVDPPHRACRALVSVLPADRAGGAEEGSSPTTEVISVDPRSSVGLLVRLRFPLSDGNAGMLLPAHRRSSGDLQVSLECGATRWPWGRPGRRVARLTIPQADLAVAVERWAATQTQSWSPDEIGRERPVPSRPETRRVDPGPLPAQRREPPPPAPRREAPPPPAPRREAPPPPAPRREAPPPPAPRREAPPPPAPRREAPPPPAPRREAPPPPAPRRVAPPPPVPRREAPPPPAPRREAPPPPALRREAPPPPAPPREAPPPSAPPREAPRAAPVAGIGQAVARPGNGRTDETGPAPGARKDNDVERKAPPAPERGSAPSPPPPGSSGRSGEDEGGRPRGGQSQASAPPTPASPPPGPRPDERDDAERKDSAAGGRPERPERPPTEGATKKDAPARNRPAGEAPAGGDEG